MASRSRVDESFVFDRIAGCFPRSQYPRAEYKIDLQSIKRWFVSDEVVVPGSSRKDGIQERYFYAF